MLPDRDIEPRTPDLQVRCPTDCATWPGPKPLTSTLGWQQLPDDANFYKIYIIMHQKAPFTFRAVPGMFASPTGKALFFQPRCL